MHALILAATVTTPHLHWPGWLTGFGGGTIFGLVLGIFLDKSKRI